MNALAILTHKEGYLKSASYPLSEQVLKTEAYLTTLSATDQLETPKPTGDE